MTTYSYRWVLYRVDKDADVLVDSGLAETFGKALQKAEGSHHWWGNKNPGLVYRSAVRATPESDEEAQE